ncbi:MAG: GLUG motif-containing protein, partial [Thermoplasmatota archaeon]
MRSLPALIIAMLVFTAFPFVDPDTISEGIFTEAPFDEPVMWFGPDIGYSGGNGTRDNPFQIGNISQLQNVIHNLSSHFIIINDIDASSTNSWNNGSGFLPLGNQISPFNGTFDGGHFNISGLSIDRPTVNHVGLIGYATNNTEISNVTLTSCKVEGYDYVGGLLAFTKGTRMSNCSVTGDVEGRNLVGGIVGGTLVNKWSKNTMVSCFSHSNVSGSDSVGCIGGSVYGNISDCRSYGNVISINSHAGGLIGHFGGTMNNCLSSAEVNGLKWSGGLIGSAGTVYKLTRSNALGNVSGTRYVGGLIGSASGNIDNCSAHGDVTGEDEGVGGLIGTKSGGTLENCFATGDVTADSEAGGLVGINRWSLWDCYSTGKVTAASRSGASIGDNQGTVKRTLFNNQTSGILVGIGAGTTSGAAGKTLENMLQNSTYKNWNFTDIWGIGNGQTYPYFRWKENQPPVIVTSDVTIATTEAPYVFGYERVENDVTDIFPRWNLNTDARWLHVNSAAGLLHGLPGSTDLGPYFVNISVNDGREGIDFHNFTLIMNSTNNVPKISTTPVKFVAEDDVYYVDYEASADVGDVLEWSLLTNASWLEMDSPTGIITGYPDYTEIGSYSLNVTVTDGQGAVDWQEFTLTVNETNDDPIITTKDVTETYEHLLYQVQYNAKDEENDAMVWSFKSNAS